MSGIGQKLSVFFLGGADTNDLEKVPYHNFREALINYFPSDFIGLYNFFEMSYFLKGRVNISNLTKIKLKQFHFVKKKCNGKSQHQQKALSKFHIINSVSHLPCHITKECDLRASLIRPCMGHI